MKLYFFGFEEWSGIATMLGYDVGFGNVLEDVPTNVVFIPEYVPVSHIKCRHAQIVVVWKDYSLGVIENINHSVNIVTDASLIDKVKNATWIPESVHQIFSIMRAVSEKRDRPVVTDEELENKSQFERAHIFKCTQSYQGKKYAKEAYEAGCDVVVNSYRDFKSESKECVAKHLNEFLQKLKIFMSMRINDPPTAAI
jgi:hypothetical protein